MQDPICRARDPFFCSPRLRQYAARTTLCDARVTPFAARTAPFYRARDLSGAGDSGVRDPFFRTRDLSGAGDFAPRNPTYPT